VDRFLHQEGDPFRALTNPAATPPGKVVLRSNLEIHELEGGITRGPAQMIQVNLQPMEAQILAKA
jgi:hypothetical protein